MHCFHAIADDIEFELLLEGTKFFDTRAKRGGAGACNAPIRTRLQGRSESLVGGYANGVGQALRLWPEPHTRFGSKLL